MFQELYLRNPIMFGFGLVSLICALVCLVLVFFHDQYVLGINAWIKPTKFYISTTFFVWSMAWYIHYLPPQYAATLRAFNWTVVLVLSFELIYISWSAAIGELSHFNVSTAFKSSMFSLMGIAISLMTLFTAYIGILFFKEPLPNLDPSFVWAIRLGILLFVVFAFQGAMMGSQLAHTVGGPDGGPGLKFFNWSIKHGDLRIAHFVGMHALQVLPITAYFLLKDVKLVLAFGTAYALLALFVLLTALRGLPLIRL